MNIDTCPKCGEKTEREARFCGNCGHQLVIDTSPETPDAIAAEAVAGDVIPAYAQPDPAVRQADGKAFTTFILAIVGLFMFWLPIVGLVVAVVSIVMGIRARHNASSKATATAAIIIGSLTIIVIAAVIVLSAIFPFIADGNF